MIQSIITHHCTKCNSFSIVKNGTDCKGTQKFHCRECNAYGTLEPESRSYPGFFKESVLRDYQERASMRGIERIFGIARQTPARWIFEKAELLPVPADTLKTPEADDVPEFDELWSSVFKKNNKRRIWTALCRRTRKVAAYFIGGRSENSCRELWKRIPDAYRRCRSFSDFWKTYQEVFSSDTHQSTGKESGGTAHIERWNSTLRQRPARFIRKTLSFSKSDIFHEAVLKLYIHYYNLKWCPIS